MARKFFEVSYSSLTAINLHWGHCWFTSLVICIGCSYFKAFEFLVRLWLKFAIEIIPAVQYLFTIYLYKR